MSFHNAEQFCVSEFDGNLASITTSVEFNDVIQMLDDFKPEDEEIYIGAVEKKSRWIWTSGNILSKCHDLYLMVRNLGR